MQQVISNEYNITPYATKDDLDGKWQMKYAELDANKKTNGKNTYTYDLSSYLPDDGNIYDVLISAAAWTTPNSTNGDLLVFDCTTDIFERDGVSKNLCLLRIGGVTTTNQSSSVIVPVGTGRTIKTIIDVQNSGNNRASIWLLGYRKAR